MNWIIKRINRIKRNIINLIINKIKERLIKDKDNLILWFFINEIIKEEFVFKFLYKIND